MIDLKSITNQKYDLRKDLNQDSLMNNKEFNESMDNTLKIAMEMKGIELFKNYNDYLNTCDAEKKDFLEDIYNFLNSFCAKANNINISDMSADNILKGLVKPAYFEDLKDAVVIDVRPNMIYKMGTIEGAINIPIAEIRERLDEIPRDKKVILSCNTGYTSYCASRILAQKSFNNVYSFMGGYELYKELVKESAKLNHA